MHYALKKLKDGPATQAGTRQNSMPFLYLKASQKFQALLRNYSCIFVKDHWWFGYSPPPRKISQKESILLPTPNVSGAKCSRHTEAMFQTAMFFPATPCEEFLLRGRPIAALHRGFTHRVRGLHQRGLHQLQVGATTHGTAPRHWVEPIPNGRVSLGGCEYHGNRGAWCCNIFFGNSCDTHWDCMSFFDLKLGQWS